MKALIALLPKLNAGIARHLKDVFLQTAEKNGKPY
jgi:hypothetical protein